MNDDITQALESDRVIDITTIGRKSGMERRIEMWFHNIDGRIFLTGSPGRRGWYANLVANPQFTFHIKVSAQADLAATARAITEPVERKPILDTLLDRLGHSDRFDEWMKRSPLVEVTFA